MYLTEPKRLIMRALDHGPLELEAIASATQLAPFMVRADLQGLRRAGYVLENFAGRTLRYELSTRGWGELYEGQQLRLIG